MSGGNNAKLSSSSSEGGSPDPLSPVHLDTRIPRHTENLAQLFVVLLSHLITQDRTRHMNAVSSILCYE